tara:strand:+ start:175 stop:1284 length:1110 start_codon:yes stop_codon:yes gene_type:complete
MDEFINRYGKYANKIEIFPIDTRERGVFATEDIKVGDVLLAMPPSEMWVGTHLEMTKKLKEMDNEYTRALPVDLTNFPVMWSPSQIQSLEGSAMKEMIPSRKKKLMEEMETEDVLMLRNRLMVGSRGFTVDEDRVAMVPYADMMNHSDDYNVDWKYTEKAFLMRALREIKKGEELYDSYGSKTNYENLLFYGMVLENNTDHDITYELIEIPPAFRTNLNFNYFHETIEYELCGSYTRGTVEIFSLLRFLICANANKNECPKQLLGFHCHPISVKNECMMAKLMYNSLLNTYNEKIVKLKDATGKVGDFVQTELDVISKWLHHLPEVVKILSCKTQKEAKKACNKLSFSTEYVQKCIRPLIAKKSSYKTK